MTSLAKLQAEFQAFVLGRDSGEGSGIEQLTVGSQRLPSSTRLAVYADAYRLRLLEVLADDFPGLEALVGEEAFEALGMAYIRAHPSDHPSVRWFGRYMARFLAESPVHRDRGPALAEMAAFEWLQGEVMDAADDTVVKVAALGALRPESWPGMRIVFQRALRRIDLSWNIPAVWKALRENTPPPPLQRSQCMPWLLWRRGVEVHWRSLDSEERLAIDAVREGRTFGALCEAMMERGGGEIPMRAAALLKRWAVDGLVAGIRA